DLTEPSPRALGVLSARTYAYLEGAPLEERRTQAVMSRRWLDPQSAADLGKLDAEAIRRVREEAWPDATDADELHDALLWLTYLTDAEVARGAGWTDLIAQLAAQRRVTHIVGAGAGVWVTAERLPLFAALFPAARPEPAVTTPAGRAQSVSSEAALVEAARGRLEGLGPTTAAALAAELAMPTSRVETALAALQAEGFAMRGAFTDTPPPEGEWCERRLLARIHSYTVKRLRAEIEPIEARHADRAARAAQSTPVVVPDRVGGCDAPVGERTARGAASVRAWRILLRRDRARDRAAAHAVRGGARRAGGARPGELRQLRGAARAAASRRPPQTRHGRSPAATHRAVRDGRRGTLVAHRTPRGGRGRCCRKSRPGRG